MAYKFDLIEWLKIAAIGEIPALLLLTGLAAAVAAIGVPLTTFSDYSTDLVLVFAKAILFTLVAAFVVGNWLAKRLGILYSNEWFRVFTVFTIAGFISLLLVGSFPALVLSLVGIGFFAAIKAFTVWIAYSILKWKIPR